MHNVMKLLSKLGFIIPACGIFLIFVAACTAAPLKVIQQPAPQLTPMDLEPFKDNGCTWQSDKYAICESNSPFKKMGCDTLTAPSAYLSLFGPGLSIVECNYAPLLKEIPEDNAEGVYNSGCSTPVLKRFIIFQDGDYHLIQNISVLQSEFSPINNDQQALAYAIAATGYQPLYNFDKPGNFRYFVDTIEETSVTVVENGYKVILYHYQICGCGPHTMFNSNVIVHSDGSIEKIDPQPIYEDPQNDDLCVD